MKVQYAVSRKTIRTRYKLAQVCGVKPQAVYQWGERVPEKHIPTIRQFLSGGGG